MECNGKLGSGGAPDICLLNGGESDDEDLTVFKAKNKRQSTKYIAVRSDTSFGDAGAR
jgi:hypothetical protein